mmetsp:Transcript_521/g.1927  ORF Transcript_521/g.1927 Transcript_521/m.1927 type:complete len:81 (-) Transcript_521:1243-1485(-)
MRCTQNKKNAARGDLRSCPSLFTMKKKRFKNCLSMMLFWMLQLSQDLHQHLQICTQPSHLRTAASSSPSACYIDTQELLS